MKTLNAPKVLFFFNKKSSQFYFDHTMNSEERVATWPAFDAL